jgi:hypothetical protein
MKKHVSKVDDLSEVKAILMDRFCQFTTIATLQRRDFIFQMSRVIDGYSASSALFHTCSIQAWFFFMGIVLLFMHPTQAST